MIEGNRRLVLSVLDYIGQFTTGELDLEEMQYKLQLSAELWERDTINLADPLRLAEVDLEEIAFTTLADEQRPAAILRLDSLRAALVDSLEHDRSD